MTSDSTMAAALKIFEEVLATGDSEPLQLVEELCREDASLRSQVLRLMEAHERGERDGLLEESIALPIPPLMEGAVIAERFRLVRHIGSGGSGDVYHAEDLKDDCAPLAVKILSPLAAVTDERAIDRFLHEAEQAAKLDHPNIVPVFSAGEDRGLYYYVMQLIHGQDLAQRLEIWRDQGRELDPERIREIVEIVIQAARGLHHAHEMLLIHRDVKPGNLLLDETGNVWITDFGLARLRHRQASLTASGAFCGTLPYLSPEQVSEGRLPVDVHTDIYSLGVALYEMFALRRPFEECEPGELLRRIAEDEPERLRILKPAVPPDVEAIVRKAMAKEPKHRYSTAKELAADLERFLQGQKPLAAGDGDLRTALDSVRTGLLRITDSAIEMLDRWALLEPALSGVQQELLKTALSAFDNLTRRERDVVWRTKAADACRRVGEVQRRLGQFDEARTGLTQAVQLAQALVEEHPQDPKLTKILARTQLSLGILLCDFEETGAAQQLLGDCSRLCEEALKIGPADIGLDGWSGLAIAANLNLGVTAKDHQDAEKYLRRAVELSRSLQRDSSETDASPRLWVALSLYRLGLVLEITGMPGEADRCYEEVLEVASQLSSAIAAPGLGRFLGRNLVSEFDVRAFAPNPIQRPQIEPLYQASIWVLQQLAQHEVVPEYRLYLGMRHIAYGQLLITLDRNQEAENEFRDAVRVYEALMNEFGNLPEYCDNLAASESHLADVLSGLGQDEEAERHWIRGLELGEQLIQRTSQIVRYRRTLARDHERRAEYLERQDRFEEARWHRQRCRQLSSSFEKQSSINKESAV